MKHPTPKPYLLQRVYDIRSWIESHAVELHAHTVPKCFKFELNDAGKAVMYYRSWSHEQWQGPIVVLKVNITLKILLWKHPYYLLSGWAKCKILNFCLEVVLYHVQHAPCIFVQRAEYFSFQPGPSNKCFIVSLFVNLRFIAKYPSYICITQWTLK